MYIYIYIYIYTYIYIHIYIYIYIQIFHSVDVIIFDMRHVKMTISRN